jgi:hypothetical protein
MFGLIVPIGITLLGAVVFVRARALSERYNAWTTRFRERSPHINPPTPAARAQNVQTMTNLFRMFGIVVVGSMIWNAGVTILSR